ncbi:MAG: BLUF domain-containing protein [Pseudomonadota bacterium]
MDFNTNRRNSWARPAAQLPNSLCRTRKIPYQDLMEMISLVYVSRSLVGSRSPQMDAIAATSQRKNQLCGLTGFLYYDNEAFLQVLEGESETVRGLYEMIEADSRHDKVHLVGAHPVKHRAFGGWAMGLYDGTLQGGLLGESFGEGLFDRVQEMDMPEVMRFLRDLSVGRDDVYALPSMA